MIIDTSQMRLLKDYIREQHWHLLPHHEFLDEGIRGARLDRPALDRLRDGAQRGEFGGIARSLIPFLYRFWSFRAINTLF